MQFNPPSMYAWLVFDLDDVPDGFSWDDAGVPPPNLVVRSRTENSQHWYYAINPVTRGERAREHPTAYMKAVYAAMAHKIAPADLNYSNGPVARTPGHTHWHTVEIHPHEYSLNELADYAEPISGRHAVDANDEGDQGSRHLWLFHYLRKAVAYPSVDRYRERNDYTGFLRHIQVAASGANTFNQRGWGKSNLTAAQIRAICKSIARWTWTRYRGQVNGCARGIMALDVTLPLEVRQSLSARRTHSQRAMRTRLKIHAAVRSLAAQGCPLTLTAIAAEAGITRQTVAAHKDAISSLTCGPDTRPDTADPQTIQQQPARASLSSTVVNFGAHKITSSGPGLTSPRWTESVKGHCDAGSADSSVVVHVVPGKRKRMTVVKGGNAARDRKNEPP